MSTHTRSLFEGYSELIEKPLERSDLRSLSLIQKLLSHRKTERTHECPFSFLIQALSDVAVSQREARTHWKKILDHKRRMEFTLNRIVNIKTAAIDYYDQLGIIIDAITAPSVREGILTVLHAPSSHHPLPDGAISPQAPLADRKLLEGGDAVAEFGKGIKGVGKSDSENEKLFDRVSAPGYHQERLKEEMLRARRYKHALSAIMLDIDLNACNASPISPHIRDRVFAIIIKMINKAVRTVDILARHAESSFLLILPNTNKREALELAERLKTGIIQRIQRIPELSGGVLLTISVGQCSKDDASSDFIKRLENLAESKKGTAPNAVHALE